MTPNLYQVKQLRFGIFIISLLFVQQLNAQDFDFGIRAGLSYSKFVGPTDNHGMESYSFNGGFHFGVNFRYNFSKFFSIQTEFLYNQNGNKYDFSGVGYYIFPGAGDGRASVIDSSWVSYKNSNAYLTFPFTAHIRTLEKWEFFGGAYVGFLVSPVATGDWIFGEVGADHAFDQLIDYNFNKDEVGEFNVFSNTIAIIVNGENYDLPRIVGAYFFYEQKPANRLKSVDLGLTGGISYYLNPGLYLSVRADYGFTDITNNNVDISLSQLNSDGSFIYQEDKDSHFGLHFSLGFKF